MRLNFGRNARAVVSDFDQNVARLQFRADFQPPPVRHRVNRVVNQIRPNLIEQTSVRRDARQIFVVFARDVMFFVFNLCLRISRVLSKPL
jgi:hypothetical protein